MATRREQKQQSNAKKAPSANPAREANTSDSIAGNLLGPAHFPTLIEVDRVHRLGQPPDTGVRPCVMIARIHSFWMKEEILRLARKNTPLTYNGRQLHIYPDFPAETMKQCQQFEEVRKKFNNAGMRTGFLYPACYDVYCLLTEGTLAN